MADQVHDYSDEKLEEIKERVAREYSAALSQLKGKMKDFEEWYSKENEKWKKLVADGDKTQEDYDKWLKDQAATSRLWRERVDDMAADLTHAGEISAAIVNGTLPEIYAENYNWGTYEIEHGTTIETAYTLYDRDTVYQLIRNGDIPYPQASVDVPKDKRWNRQHLASAITQGILQGESIHDISKRLLTVATMSSASAVRAARTCVTAAENSGRIDSYKRAEGLGISIKKEWLATLDTRTRTSHRHLDGEKVEVGEKFSNGLSFPGDPEGAGSDIYNCRCTLVADLEDFPADNVNRASKLGKMSYDEWKTGHKPAVRQAIASHRVAEGQNILGQWTRRPDEYDFEIEDVMAAQGYDGLPRVVDESEFDELVKQANGGNGFIAQRSYTGSSKEVADEYRRMLYEGKWYVDCSTGGAQYGQGMYCAADYTGKLTEGIRAEMAHYTELGKERSGSNAVTYIETLTLDPSAKVITYSKAKSQKNLDAVALSDRLRKERSDKILSDSEIYGADADYVRWKLGILEEKPKAEITYSQEDLDELVDYAREDIREYLDRSEELSSLRDMNLSSWAAAKGYDAINAEGHGDSGSYTVVLNRTKLIIKRPEEWQ